MSSHATSVLVVARPDGLLASLLATRQMATTPLGPADLEWAPGFDHGIAALAARPFEACLVDASLGRAGCLGFVRVAREMDWRRPLLVLEPDDEPGLEAVARAAGATDVVPVRSLSVSSLGRLLQAAIQRSRFEETLRFGEDALRLLIEGTRDYGIFMLDREGRIVSWNQGAERISGYAAAEALGRHVGMLWADADRADLRPAAVLREALAYGRFQEEGPRRRKDGRPYWADVVVTPLYDLDGRLRGFSAVVRDVTRQREERDERLRQAEVSLEAFQAHPLAGCVATLRTARVVDVNPAFCRLFGYRREEVVGHDLGELAGLGWLRAPALSSGAGGAAARGTEAESEAEVPGCAGGCRRLRATFSGLRALGQECFLAVVQEAPPWAAHGGAAHGAPDPSGIVPA